MNVFTEVLSPSFLLRDALYTSVVIGLACPVVGVFLVLRRMVFMGVALPQLSSTGVALALSLHALGHIHVEHGTLDEHSLAFVGALTFSILAVTALALIGLFNIAGTWTAGRLGARLPKRYLLTGIYTMRSIVITLFLLAPLSPLSVYLFASTMGLLWLSTIPLTNGIVGVVFGVRYLAMLGGFVFFSHQIGSFFGVWLGGLLYDRTGNYNTVWMIAIALGIFAALINLPIKERALVRAVPAT